MKLGFFDSGVGGLVIAKSVMEKMPQLDMIYLGDTLHLPYGSRSQELIYQYTLQAMQYLLEAQDCKLVIVACNTASAAALRRIQQGYLAQNFPDRRILGVVVPTLEIAIELGCKRLGLIGTNFIIQSGVYEDELKKIDPEITLASVATPLLVPLIENGGQEWLDSVLQHYLGPLIERGIDSLILGCTHYGSVKENIRRLYPKIRVISQDEIIPLKLEDYFRRHPHFFAAINKNRQHIYQVTDLTDSYRAAAFDIYKSPITIEKVTLG